MSKLWEETEIEVGSLKRTAFVRGGLMVVYKLDEDFIAWPTGQLTTTASLRFPGPRNQKIR